MSLARGSIRSDLRTVAAVALAFSLASGLSGCIHFDTDTWRFVVDVNDESGTSGLDDQLAKAASHYKDAHYGLAVDAYEVALTYNRKSVRALNGVAASYDQLGRFDLAHRYYGRALALDPNSPMTLNNVGYSMLMQGQPKEAMKYFQRAQSHESKNAIVKANMELARAETKRLQHFASLAKAPVKVIKEPAPPPVTWVERTDAHTQTLITKPDPRVLQIATDTGLDPRWFSVDGKLAGNEAAQVSDARGKDDAAKLVTIIAAAASLQPDRHR